jgi:hypothetical protein
MFMTNPAILINTYLEKGKESEIQDAGKEII